MAWSTGATRIGGAGTVAAKMAGLVPIAGHLAVEREADGVQHAGLAGAGVSGEQEQPTGGKVVEVDVDGLDEGAERSDRQVVQAHQPLTTLSRALTRSGSSEQHSRAVRSRSASAGLAGAPRTWLTKSSDTSCADRP